ncbi:indole-3-pyruvate monooxygenase YUCCA8-like [Phragmites australis]|uniref:indole-3-pyruvate monooxygenase YUCCA8-like n=1 Tax=Phragmites australis TaxID=29695 RepID=UPI002D76F388|nr:indole-3-pyruvate monooxygenase YUCCA8-like [Phragmites australis]
MHRLAAMQEQAAADTSPRRESSSCVDVHGPIIVGAGPSGLAVAATLRLHEVPFTVLERSDGIADLWTNRTYDRLRLHLPKVFCELPHVGFPLDFPTYPTKHDFLRYLGSYAARFNVSPLFGRTVTGARFDAATSHWRVTAVSAADGEATEYVSPWLVVASGENAEVVVPKMKGRERFAGEVLHSSEYRSGERFKATKVLVVGCGNSGMEMCLDLCENGAMPFMSVRSGVHVLPREMFGTSTFGIAMKLLKWLPIKLVDRFLLFVAKMILGDTEKYGLRRPKLGPLEIKNITGKSPVLDVGAWSLIKSGNIKIVPEVESFSGNGARFVDGKEMAFDAVIFATGYRSNVPSWLKDGELFTEDGKPKAQHPSNWRGPNGLYCVGFSGRGLLGAGADALRAAADIAGRWQELAAAAGAKISSV